MSQIATSSFTDFYFREIPLALLRFFRIQNYEHSGRSRAERIGHFLMQQQFPDAHSFTFFIFLCTIC